MNLGALATITEKNPPNFYHFLLDNGVYATTGGQPVPNAQNVAYDVIAQGSGYPSTYSFDNLEDFTNNIEGILSRPGPVFVAMKVVAEIENVPIGQRVRWQKKTRGQTILDMQNDLGPRVV
jgi:thiamine pyrophosphate-dependent acetolactate synthase large subunit-like protein